jgi:hypothetical protein
MVVQVAVCGPASATDAELTHARRVGELLAERGLSAVLASVSRHTNT